jgi:transposase
MDNPPEPRTKGMHLTDIEIAKILGLTKAKMSRRKIASLMKCSAAAVQHALTTFLFETFNGRHQRREYQRKTTEREDRYIIRAINQNNSLPLRDITNVINNKIDVPISTTTIRRRRSEAGLNNYIAAKKPGLSTEKYQNWTVEDWKKMIWSDESSIWIGVNPRRQWVIRSKGERLNPRYINKTFKSAQVKVMVWACFTGERLGTLIVMKGGSVQRNMRIFYMMDYSP